MLLHRFKFSIWSVVSLLLTILLAAPVISAQPAELEVGIENLGIEPGTSQFSIGVFMRNTVDTVIHFNILIQLDRPDIIYFEPDIDTVGTLISGWESVQIVPLGEFENAIEIDAQANLSNPPEITPGIGPQSGETPLFKLLASLDELPDTMPDQTVTIHMLTYPSWFRFYNQEEQVIGLNHETVCDSVHFLCLQWVEDTICLYWEKVSFPPYDSSAYECENLPFIDSSIVKTYPGSVTAMLSTCGDVDGNGEVDISDITRIISYLYLGGDPPPVLRVANPDGSTDGTIDISDITYLIAALYIDHREMICPYIPPEE
jgi:hypothetical protein